jgi:DNA-binding transcriptional MerR regulator
MGDRFTEKRLIGSVAAELGIKAGTLRYYESIGLLPAPRRTRSGYRIYDGRAAQRIGFITRAKHLGLTLREIGDILRVFDGGEAPCRTVQQLLQRHVDRIEDQIRSLRARKAELRTFLADWPIACDTNGTAVCPKIEDHHVDSRASRPTFRRGDVHGEDRVPVPRLRSVPDR